MPGGTRKTGGGQRVNPQGTLAVLAGAFLALTGCSMDYRATEVAEKAAAGVPDTVAVDIVHKIFKNGHLSFVLSASQAETFNAQKKTIISEARFEELDDTGTKVTEGQAGSIVFHSDTENAEILGIRQRPFRLREGHGESGLPLLGQQREKALRAARGDGGCKKRRRLLHSRNGVSGGLPYPTSLLHGTGRRHVCLGREEKVEPASHGPDWPSAS